MRAAPMLRTHARAIVLAVAVLAVATGGSVTYLATRPGEPVFCTTGGVIFPLDGQEVWPEDQGDPGRGDCDGEKVMARAATLGFDCKLRGPGGAVVDTLEPNRADGTCGQPDPGGDWPS